MGFSSVNTVDWSGKYAYHFLYHSAEQDGQSEDFSDLHAIRISAETLTILSDRILGSQPVVMKSF
jgi:hypothetical protein